MIDSARRLRATLGVILSGILAGVLALGFAPMPAAAASTGTLELARGRAAVQTITDESLGDAGALATFTVPAQRTVYLALQLRSASTSTGYRAKIRITADGAVWAGFSRAAGSTETTIAGDLTGKTVSTGQRLVVEGKVTGTNPVQLWVRTWVEGGSKPDWQETATDSSSSRITTAGAIRAWGYLGSGSAAVPFSNASSYKVGTAPAAAAPVSSGATLVKPSAATTGVPSGTTLTQHTGDITVTKDGTVLDRMDIHGFVIVRAANVKITNSIVRGGRNKGYATGLITNYGYSNLLIEDVDVKAEYPSVYFDGIKGDNFTARRVHVVGNVDSVKVQGSNVRVEDSLLENTTWYANDPYQSDGPTHNDNVQIQKGTNLRIERNTIRGAQNFGILGAASQANATMVIANNWLDGGHCTVKLERSSSWLATATVTGNKFGPNREVKNCALVATTPVVVTAAGNVYEATGALASLLRVSS